MVNMCFKCNRLINDNDSVVLGVSGKYKKISSQNMFALEKDIAYLIHTLQHEDCGEEEIIG